MQREAHFFGLVDMHIPIAPVVGCLIARVHDRGADLVRGYPLVRERACDLRSWRAVLTSCFRRGNKALEQRRRSGRRSRGQCGPKIAGRRYSGTTVATVVTASSYISAEATTPTIAHRPPSASMA